MTLVPQRLRRWKSAAIAAALGAVALTAACARHEVDPVFRRSVSIGDRGISVPLPPPSLFEAPKQSVDVHVEIEGQGRLVAGVELNVIDLNGELEETVVLTDAEETTTLEGVTLDLTDNCLEFWLVDGEAQSERTQYRGTIAADGQSVQTVAGCD